jgi:hypothetical protein
MCKTKCISDFRKMGGGKNGLRKAKNPFRVMEVFVMFIMVVFYEHESANNNQIIPLKYTDNCTKRLYFDKAAKKSPKIYQKRILTPLLPPRNSTEESYWHSGW